MKLPFNIQPKRTPLQEHALKTAKEMNRIANKMFNE